MGGEAGEVHALAPAALTRGLGWHQSDGKA